MKHLKEWGNTFILKANIHKSTKITHLNLHTNDKKLDINSKIWEREIVFPNALRPTKVLKEHSLP